MSGNNDGQSILAKPTKQLETFNPVGLSPTHFFTTYNPDHIEQELTTYLSKQEIELSGENENKYKLTFEMEAQQK